MKSAIDARRRELVAVDNLPPHGTDDAYRAGCRCRPCLDFQTARRKRYRQAHREAENAYSRAYRKRKRKEAA